MNEHWVVSESMPGPEDRHRDWLKLGKEGFDRWRWFDAPNRWILVEENCYANKTTMTHDEMIAVIVADEAGKKIQGCHKNQPFVFDVKDHVFNFHHYNYWVVSEPRHAWFKWVHPCPGSEGWEQCSKGDPCAVEFVEFVR